MFNRVRESHSWEEGRGQQVSYIIPVSKSFSHTLNIQMKSLSVLGVNSFFFLSSSLAPAFFPCSPQSLCSVTPLPGRMLWRLRGGGSAPLTEEWSSLYFSAQYFCWLSSLLGESRELSNVFYVSYKNIKRKHGQFCSQ